MQFASLGSGSRGNATLIRHGKTTLMVDCGFSARETEKRLLHYGLSAKAINGILVTHEHADHVQGIRVLAQKHRIPVFATPGTAGGLAEELRPWIHEFNNHDRFVIQDIEIEPFPVPHDAREPSQFVFHSGLHRIGLLTDVGMSTPIIESALSGCDALLLEANHDIAMLAQSEYPDYLKMRVGGRFGHLNNVQSATLLEKIDTSKLQHIIAMHISEKNNLPELVSPLFAAALNCEQDWIGIAQQDAGFAWRELINS